MINAKVQCKELKCQLTEEVTFAYPMEQPHIPTPTKVIRTVYGVENGEALPS
jgi:hypothetical protein